MLRDVLTTSDDGHSDDYSLRGPFREKNLSTPAAAGYFSLDASFGLLATASASAPALFLGSAQLLWCELYVMGLPPKKRNGGYV